jgi:hypothetical protein
MQLRVPETMAPGTKVKCPKCAVMFETPHPEAASAPPPILAAAPPTPPARPIDEPTADYHPPDAGGQPRYRKPGWEPPDLDFGAQGAPARGIDDLSPNYSIDFNELFAVAKQHWSAVVGPMIGYAIVYGIICIFMGLVPGLGGLAQLVLNAPLQAGFIIVSLAQLKGRSWSFGDFFSGFNWFANIWVANFLSGLAAVACVIPGVIMLLIAIAGRNPALIVIGVVTMIVSAFGAFYVVIRLSLFANALIVDRNCSSIEALQGSWRLTDGHFWGWFGVMLLIGLMSFGALIPGYALIIIAAASKTPELLVFAILLLLGGVVVALFLFPLSNLIIAAGYLAITRPRRMYDDGPM